jgi:signal transduction histidine kinase
VAGEWDRHRLEQVFINLLTNALKYGEGKPVEVRLSAKGDKAVLEVEDHGVGIAPEDQRRIFDRFERLEATRHVSGLGLGLYIVREIVRAHGGDITVRSAVGEGSTFVVTLPLQPPASR